MDLLDRYVHAVKSYLPKGQQADIGEELSDAILSQMEELEAKHGRPLEPAEREAVLRQYGHPMLVASRYRPRQHLIGPALVPFYWAALKLMLWVVVGLFFVKTAIAVYAGGDVAAPLIGLWNAAFFSIGFVTVAFALLEHYQVKLRFLDDWNPRNLPAVGARQVPRSETIVGLVFGTIFVLYWVDAPPFDSIVFGGDGVRITLAPIWGAFYVPILVLALVNLAQNAVNLVRPEWTWLRAATRVATNLGGLIVLYFVLQGDPLILMEHGGGEDARFDRLADLVNRLIRLTLIGVGVACVIEAILNVRRLLRPFVEARSAGRMARP